jgi:hypothetical protein
MACRNGVGNPTSVGMRKAGGLPIVATHPEPMPPRRPIAMTTSLRLLLVPVLSLVAATVLVAQPPADDAHQHPPGTGAQVRGDASGPHAPRLVAGARRGPMQRSAFGLDPGASE